MSTHQFAGSVMLGDLDDYITPSQGCVNPLLSEPEPKSGKSSGAAKISLDSGVLSGVPAEANLIKKGGSGGTNATVSLTDCLACSGCVTSAESVLIQQQSADKFMAEKYKHVVVSLSPQSVASFAVSMGTGVLPAFERLAAFFRSVGATHVVDTAAASDVALLETASEFLRRWEARDSVRPAWEAPAPTLAAARQITIARPSDAEGVLPSVAVDAAFERYRGDAAGKASSSSTTVAAAEEAAVAPAADASGGAGGTSVSASTAGPLPLLTSACPGWVCYAEKIHPESLPYISGVKSPQQITGVLLKHVLAGGVAGAEEGADGAVSPTDIFHATVMPCFDKKLEATRRDFVDAVSGAAEVDCVLTTTEVADMMATMGEGDADMGDAEAGAASVASEGGVDAVLRALRPDGSLQSAAAHTAGSGGFLDFTFRRAARELYGVDVPPGPLPFKKGRNPDFQEVALEVDGVKVLRFAKAYGFRNIQGIINKLKRGKCPYAFVEIMACPSGCVNGGGQLKPPEAAAASATGGDGGGAGGGVVALDSGAGAPAPASVGRAAAARGKAHVKHVDAALAGARVLREPEAAPGVAAAYGALGCAPGDAPARELLHTRYHTVPKLPDNAFAIKW